MFKFLILFCVFVAANAGSYVYSNKDIDTSASVTHAAQPAHHDDGYQKHYYYFNGPEEHVNHQQVIKKIAPQKVKKNLNVIFIKPPETHVHKKTPVNIVQNTAVEEKTHIYILQKEPSHAAKVSQIQHLQQPTVQRHKPEVHHLKYHTAEEAQKLQDSIILQHGGKPSEVIHINANSNGGHHTTHTAHTAHAIDRQYLAPKLTGAESAPANTYIPPAIRY